MGRTDPALPGARPASASSTRIPSTVYRAMTQYASRTLLPIVALALSLSGCSSPAEPSLESACLPAVLLGGTVYQLAPDERPPAEAPPAEVVAVVQRLNAVCPDTPGAPGAPLVADGDSNFFPVGTTLHAIPGVSPMERVAVEWLGEWLVLEAEAGSGETG